MLSMSVRKVTFVYQVLNLIVIDGYFKGCYMSCTQHKFKSFMLLRLHH